jgi:hypothetical protein
VSGQLHTPVALPSGKEPLATIGEEVGWTLEQRKFMTLPGLELRPLGRPARSQSLYRLRYPGSYPELVQPHIPLRSILIFCHLCLRLPSDVFRLNYCMHFLLSYLAWLHRFLTKIYSFEWHLWWPGKKIKFSETPLCLVCLLLSSVIFRNFVNTKAKWLGTICCGPMYKAKWAKAVMVYFKVLP